MHTTGDNLSTVRALFQAFNERDFERAASFFDPGARVTEAGTGASQPSTENMRAWSAGFPDGYVELRQATAAGDVVAAEFIGRGTHTGALPDGTAPTGRSVELHFCQIFELHQGRVVASRLYYDRAELMQQLGVAAMPGLRPAAAHPAAPAPGVH